MKRWRYWIAIGVLLLALAALIGWANAYTPLMTPRASKEWSRGRIIGMTPVSLRVDVQAAPDGGAFLGWVDLDDRLHVARVGTRGRVVADRTPVLGADVPRELRLLVGPESDVHLIWRETGEGRSLLTYARLNSAGSVQVGPLLLSLPGDEAQSPCLAFNRRGEIEVFWTGQTGIYQVTISAEGEVQGEPVLLVEDGENVSVQVDRRGIFHLAWLQDVRPRVGAIYYASFDPEQEDLSQPEEMDRAFLRTGQRLESLVVGIDNDTGYILWVIQDMKVVDSSAWYAFFPLEMPRQKKVRDLQLDEGGGPLNLWAMRGQYEMSLVALTESVMTPDGPQLQIGVLPLRGEQSPGDRAWAAVGSRGAQLASPIALDVLRYTGNSPLAIRHSPFAIRHLPFVQSDWPEDQYVVTASDRPSLDPSLAVDAQGNLHLTWLETGGFGVYRVAYASTAPGVKETYDALTLWDVTDRAMGIAMQLFLVVGLTPVLAISWSLFPLTWLIGYHLVTGHESLRVPGARVALGVSVLLEVVCTYLVYPYRSSIPPVLQWVMPPAVGAVALLLAVGYLRKRDERSLFGAFFVFALAYGLFQVLCFILLRL